MRRATLAPAALVLAALALAGCSSSKSPTAGTSQTPPPAPTTAAAAPSTAAASPSGLSKAQAAAKYEQIVGPANTALDTMSAALQKLPDSATGPDVAKITGPAADAIDTACQQLLRVAWPADVTADIKAMVTAEETVAQDLRSVEGQNAFSISNWETQIAADGGKASGAASIVRADLGLPAASNS